MKRKNEFTTIILKKELKDRMKRTFEAIGMEVTYTSIIKFLLEHYENTKEQDSKNKTVL